MSKINDLIARARKLASLARNATPSPWKIVEASGLFVHRGDMGYCDDPECGCLKSGMIAHTQKEEDAKLIAVAPEMAMLLCKLSDELEKWHHWAREWCENNCTDFFKYGKHAPNCPVADMFGED